jgi:aminopeptidase N
MQDTPAVKATYEASVIVPEGYVAKMSANDTGNQPFNSSHHVFYFHNQIPIQSYLIALAVGDLVYKETGPTTGVISESVSVDRVAAELD